MFSHNSCKFEGRHRNYRFDAKAEVQHNIMFNEYNKMPLLVCRHFAPPSFRERSLTRARTRAFKLYRESIEMERQRCKFCTFHTHTNTRIAPHFEREHFARHYKFSVSALIKIYFNFIVVFSTFGVKRKHWH